MRIVLLRLRSSLDVYHASTHRLYQSQPVYLVSLSEKERDDNNQDIDFERNRK